MKNLSEDTRSLHLDFGFPLLSSWVTQYPTTLTLGPEVLTHKCSVEDRRESDLRQASLSLVEGCGHVATAEGVSTCKWVPMSACGKRGEARGWWKLSLVVSPRSSQDGELQTQQYRFSRSPSAQWQPSTRDGQSLRAELHLAGLHSELPCLFKKAGEAKPGAWRVTEGYQGPQQWFFYLQDIHSKNSLLKLVNSDSKKKKKNSDSMGGNQVPASIKNKKWTQKPLGGMYGYVNGATNGVLNSQRGLLRQA